MPFASVFLFCFILCFSVVVVIVLFSIIFNLVRNVDVDNRRIMLCVSMFVSFLPRSVHKMHT